MFPAGSRNRAVISGASAPMGCTSSPPWAMRMSIVSETLSPLKCYPGVVAERPVTPPAYFADSIIKCARAVPALSYPPAKTFRKLPALALRGYVDVTDFAIPTGLESSALY